jgi:hypothetical protein
MSKGLIDALEWYGSIAGVIAALMVSLDLGRRATGWAFVIFCTSSVALVTWGFVSDKAEGIGTQNIFLFVINVIGVYRYLVRKTPVHPEPERA